MPTGRVQPPAVEQGIGNGETGLRETERGNDKAAPLGIAAFLYAAFVFLSGLGAWPLVDPDEGRNAEVARELLGVPLGWVPTFNGLAYLDKPIAYFHAVALSYSAFGVSEAAARVPTALAALLLCGLIYQFCRRHYSALVAALAVFVLASTPLLLAFARIVIFDLPLSLFVATAILLGFEAERSHGRARSIFSVLGAAAAGIATIIKGPVGFLLPGLVLGVHGWLTPKLLGRPRRPSAFSPLGVLVFFAVTLPWFIGLSLARPDFPQYGLIEETFRRYSTTAFHRTAPFWYYGPVLLGVFFPWSALLPEGVFRAWQLRRRLKESDLLFAIWALVVVVFFSTSRSKLPGYILPGVVALAPLAARVFVAAIQNPSGAAARLVRRGTLVLCFLTLIGGSFLLANALAPEAMRSAFRIHGSEFHRLQPIFLPVSVVFLTATLVTAFALRVRRPAILFGVFTLLPVLAVIAGWPGLKEAATVGSTFSLVRQMPELSDDTRVACLECFPPGLPFYLREPVTLFSRDGREMTSNYVMFALREQGGISNLDRVSESNDEPFAAGRVVHVSEVGAWLQSSPHPAYLISKRKGQARLDSLATVYGSTVVELRRGWWGVELPASSDSAPTTATQD